MAQNFFLNYWQGFCLTRNEKFFWEEDSHVKGIDHHGSLKEASRLGSILDDRLAEVELLTADQLKAFKAVTGSRLVAASGLVDAFGGMEALTAVARELRCDQMLIINSCADSFILKSEMNGKCLMLDLPEDAAGVNKQQSRARDYGLQLAATLICETFHVAAGDAATFTLLELAKRVAQTDVTVFINGPTGTGKEVLSKFIHHHSERKDQPFVAINCAAIPENMLEAILFGHEKGAFTGASTANKGIFRAADGGTLMLDEISEMPIGLQSKLLRVLQEKSVTPIGAQTDIPVDVRVIATTNRDMAAEIQQGVFVKTSITGLMSSRWDNKSGRTSRYILPSARSSAPPQCRAGYHPWLDEAATALCAHHWPGNVRELENVLQRALVLMSGSTITMHEIVMDNALQNLNTLVGEPVHEDRQLMQQGA